MHRSLKKNKSDQDNRKVLKNTKNGVRRVLLAGVFWRILLIEAVLLVWSLGARYFAEGHNLAMLFWYAVRIIILITIILAFMMFTLRRFLDRKIITPLETIEGKTVAMNENRITAVLKKELPPLTDIKMQLDFCTDVHCFGDIYAKIERIEKNPRGIVHLLRITYIDQKDRKILTDWIRTLSSQKLI